MYDAAQAREAEHLVAAAAHLDHRWPLASVPSDFLATTALGGLDIPEECFTGLEAVEAVVQMSLSLDALAALELVRRHMSGQERELLPMGEALHRLVNAYDAQTFRHA